MCVNSDRRDERTLARHPRNRREHGQEVCCTASLNRRKLRARNFNCIANSAFPSLQARLLLLLQLLPLLSRNDVCEANAAREHDVRRRDDEVCSYRQWGRWVRGYA